MEFLHMLSSIRIPVLTDFMLLITHLGEETAFLVIALILFWCVSKKLGYYILSVGFIGTIINQFLKLQFHIMRPWDLDPSFHAVEAAKAEATGFSFPSGHTQSSVGTFGGIACASKNKWLKGLCAALLVLVPFSRMYLGVHTPKDVIVSFVIALILVFALKPLVYRNQEQNMPWLLGAMLIISVAYVLYTCYSVFPASIEAERIAHGKESGYTLLGALLGLIAVYILDNKWLDFKVKAVWWAQILKVLGGLALVLAMKVGLKSPLNHMLGEYAGRALRYFLIVIMAGSVWPLTFKFFGSLGKKES